MYEGRTKPLPSVTSQRGVVDRLRSKTQALTLDTSSYPKIAAWARARAGEGASVSAVPTFSGGASGGGGFGGGGGGGGGSRGGGYYDEID